VPDGVGLRDLGMPRLKGLPSPVHFYQLLVDGLGNDHPPLRRLGTASALPAVGSRLLGRDREVHDLVTLLETEEARLVTLTGPSARKHNEGRAPDTSCRLSQVSP
jgi:hypothetical protein